MDKRREDRLVGELAIFGDVDSQVDDVVDDLPTDAVVLVVTSRDAFRHELLVQPTSLVNLLLVFRRVQLHQLLHRQHHPWT